VSLDLGLRHGGLVGDLLGFRGPYGSTFSIQENGKKIALVAGGYGMAPLAFLAQESVKNNIDVHLYIGARNKDELLYAPWMEEIGVQIHPATDDGSLGYKGFNTDLFSQEVYDLHPDFVYTVGPEIMEMKIANLCYEKKIPFEVSLERFMKCGFGLCGQCSVDPTGWRMCVEGPVLNGEDLKKVTEFGHHHRTASGHVISK
jgi:dihydroorotate dehydrogenase electron transfer subunit